MVDNFKPSDRPSDKITQQAYQAMVSDLLISVLDKLDDIGELSRFITGEIRQLTGARLVILMQFGHSFGHGDHILMGVNPKRRRKLADSAEINRLAELTRNLLEPVLWSPNQCGEAAEILARLKIGYAISSPLKTGRERLGCILLLGLPEDRHGISETLEMLGKLSPVIALVLHNAILFERQEDTIRARTKELLKSNKELKNEIKERKRAEEARRQALAETLQAKTALQNAHDELEKRVEERTAELASSNKALRLEIAERRQAEEEIKELNQSLEEMVYVASHDLQVPIVSMKGYTAELLNNYKDRLDEEGVYCLTRLQANARRMHTLILSLLDMSRLDTKKYPYEVFETREAIDYAVLDSELLIQKLKIKIEIEIENAPRIYGDKLRLISVFRNLITNAILYGGDKIIIGYQDQKFYIQDNGLGIPENQLEKIFSPTERLKMVEAEGVGMGLTFCKKVIRQHGGEIWAESEGLNKGAKFYFTLQPEKTSERIINHVPI